MQTLDRRAERTPSAKVLSGRGCLGIRGESDEVKRSEGGESR